MYHDFSCCADDAPCCAWPPCPDPVPPTPPCPSFDAAYASFFAYHASFTNGALIPTETMTADSTGHITHPSATQITLLPGTYLITYTCSTQLQTPGYLQITPNYNGTAHPEVGIFAKTTDALGIAAGASSIIIRVPTQTNFNLRYHSDVASTDGAATISILKL